MFKILLGCYSPALKHTGEQSGEASLRYHQHETESFASASESESCSTSSQRRPKYQANLNLI